MKGSLWYNRARGERLSLVTENMAGRNQVWLIPVTQHKGDSGRLLQTYPELHSEALSQKHK